MRDTNSENLMKTYGFNDNRFCRQKLFQPALCYDKETNSFVLAPSHLIKNFGLLEITPDASLDWEGAFCYVIMKDKKEIDEYIVEPIADSYFTEEFMSKIDGKIYYGIGPIILFDDWEAKKALL